MDQLNTEHKADLLKMTHTHTHLRSKMNTITNCRADPKWGGEFHEKVHFPLKRGRNCPLNEFWHGRWCGKLLLGTLKTCCRLSGQCWPMYVDWLVWSGIGQLHTGLIYCLLLAEKGKGSLLWQLCMFFRAWFLPWSLNVVGHGCVLFLLWCGWWGGGLRSSAAWFKAAR